MATDGHLNPSTTTDEARRAPYVRKLRRSLVESNGDVPKIAALVTEAEQNVLDLRSLLDIYQTAVRAFGTLPMLVGPAEYGEICVKQLEALCRVDPKEALQYHKFLRHSNIRWQDARVHIAIANMEAGLGRHEKARAALEAGIVADAKPAEQLRAMLQRAQSVGLRAELRTADVSGAASGTPSGTTPLLPRTLRYSGCNLGNAEAAREEAPASNAATESAPSLSAGSRSNSALCSEDTSPVREADSAKDQAMPPPPAPAKERVGEWAQRPPTVAPANSATGVDGDLSEPSFPPTDRSAGESSQKPPKLITVNGILYTREGTIGRGGTSKVYAVVSPAGEKLALKKVETNNTSHFEDLKQEVTLLQQLRHCPNVIQVLDAEINQQRGDIHIVMERGSKDLGQYFQESASDRSLGDIQVLWRQMLEAVQVIHKENIIHSDLKPSNFLLVNGRLKLIDFGIAKKIDREMTHISRDNSVGTVSYMAPEAAKSATEFGSTQMRRSSDIWSLGIILYQMVYGHVPLAHLGPMQRIFALTDPDMVVPFPDHHFLQGHSEEKKQQLFDVLSSCLCCNEQLRPQIPELLVHPFLNDSIRVTRSWFDRTMEELLTGFCEVAQSVLEDDGSSAVADRSAEAGDEDSFIPPADYWQALTDEVWDRLSESQSDSDRICGREDTMPSSRASDSTGPCRVQASGREPTKNQKLDMTPAGKVLQRFLARGNAKRQRIDGNIDEGPGGQWQPFLQPKGKGKGCPPPPKSKGKGSVVSTKVQTAAAVPGPPQHLGRPVASVASAGKKTRDVMDDRPTLNAELLQKQRGGLKKVEPGSSAAANKENVGGNTQKNSEAESLILRRLKERRSIVADDRTAEITCTQWLAAP
mmetsp:Transcript_102896/g.178518  ORF Transcript_102896/g.178518 Transcript_102896/m.178518 type:complete len:870 (-) Transcript_102896:71-2680(-)